MSDQLPVDVRIALVVGLVVVVLLFCCVPRIENWWQRSYAVYWLRCCIAGLRRRAAYPFRRGRIGSNKKDVGK